jgi:lysophospholipase-1
MPRRYHRLCYEGLYAHEVKKENVMVKEYDGMGHVMGGAELRDLCTWLERVVPEIE